jgi:hypothetical protein
MPKDAKTPCRIEHNATPRTIKRNNHHNAALICAILEINQGSIRMTVTDASSDAALAGR